MKENKEKAVTNGTEGEDVQVQEDATPLVFQKPIAQAGMRKGISSSVDLGDLPSHRGSKKQKSGKTPLPKVPKFPSTTCRPRRLGSELGTHPDHSICLA